MARISLDRAVLTGPAGSWIPHLLTVENLSPAEWRGTEDHCYTISMRPRSHTGRFLRELHSVPMLPAVLPAGD